jgi:hypothetical protein
MTLAEEGWRLMIFCARATRGRRLPSLDTRTLETARPPLQYEGTE